MMKKLLSICLALGVCLGVAARTARDFFVTAPDSVVVLLPQATRLDMLDYFEFGSTRASSNTFRGEARMTSVADGVVAFDVDKDVNMQLAVIPVAQADTMLAIVTTLHMPFADSSIRFYNADWKPLAKTPFVMPGYDEWLTPAGAAVSGDVQAELPFMPVKAEFDPEVTVLLLNNEATSYLDSSRVDSISPKIESSKVYDIRGGKFVLRK